MGNSMILPRTNENGIYLSYSQITKWNKSKNEYFKSYFFEGAFISSPYLTFGTKVGEALETGDFSEFCDEEIKTLKKVPRLDEFEREVVLKMDGFQVIGQIDTNDKELTTLIDYKTMGGEDKIPQYVDPKYIQLIIYAMAIEQETGIRPKTIKVIGIERLGGFKDVMTVGDHVYEVPLELNQDRIDYAYEVINQTANDISRHYKVFLKMRSYI